MFSSQIIQWIAITCLWICLVDAADEPCDYEYLYGPYCEFSVIYNDLYVKDISSTFVVLYTEHYRYGYPSVVDGYYLMTVDLYNRDTRDSVYLNENHDPKDVLRITNLSPNTKYRAYYSISLHLYHLDKIYTSGYGNMSFQTEPRLLSLPLSIGLTMGGITLFYIILLIGLCVCMKNNVGCFRITETLAMQIHNY